MDAKTVREVKTSSDKSKKVFKFIFLIVGELALLLFWFLLIRSQNMSLDMGFWYHDPVGGWLVYGTILIMLLITGLFFDFLRSFVYSLKQPNEITAVQIKKSLLSVKLVMVTALVSELFVLVTNYVAMWVSLGTVGAALEDVLPVSLALLGGSAVHGILPIIILLPVYARLKVRLISMRS